MMGTGGAARRERGRGRLGDPSRQNKRTESFVSPWVKWLMFSFNMFFWIVSWVLIAVGVWAYLETQEYKANDVPSSIFDIFFDISILFIFAGCVIFILAFLGAIGSLRENTCLLKTFAISLIVLFLAEVALVIAVFALADPIKTKLSELLQEEAIRDYRDDINRNNIIDWFQETFECCGVGDDGYKDWNNNKYFNCTADNPGFEACSVPYSCCRDPFTFDEQITNTRCGADMLQETKSRAVASETIFVIGCVDAAIQTAQNNMFLIGGIAVGIVVPQLIGIFLAKVLASQIEDQRARWGG